MSHPAAATPRVVPPVLQTAVVILALAAALALLHFGRAILVPVTLAVVLSFAVTPWVRTLRRWRLGPRSAVFAAVASVVLVVSWLLLLMGTHALHMAERLPAYQATLSANLDALRSGALLPQQKTWDAADALLDAQQADSGTGQPFQASAGGPAAPPTSTPLRRLQQLLSWLWGPLVSAAVVGIVMVFVLLERESLRDRFIRLIGQADLRVTTAAIDDATERLSRYLARLFVVNLGVGGAVWVALSLIGLPDAFLAAASTVVLRFVPFAGVPLAALLAMGLALGASAGWHLVLMTGAAFAAVQLITSQFIEPRLYGRATGLSPLSIVLATLFWGLLWGPVGVLISTPLTLCLAVAGRHASSLGFLDILLGNGPALTMAQKFYQRALSGDSDEIIGDAKGFMKRRTLAVYCDAVLMPAMQLGGRDFEAGAISLRQQAKIRSAVVDVVEALDGARREPGLAGSRPRPEAEVEGLSSGLLLRHKRLARQRARTLGAPGPASAAARVVVCVGMGLPGDELATELLVRILRHLGLDAYHLTASDLHSLQTAQPPASAIGTVCIVSMAARGEHAPGDALCERLGAVAPEAARFALLLPGPEAESLGNALRESVDSMGHAFERIAGEVLAHSVGGVAPLAAPQTHLHM
ncbi:AI-2E family transporter [Ideonella azotifigens]|uniref:AI-2E family transporter n=1 Tax=Ideonella azotifigens TaxID=513160 RepID=A0ABP3VPV8_9BURK|nr:AI-2E family transporter [Ideonella azotifigens]MCD2340681.1 AI-2E family transporter [Ideonella azotifigens]